MRDTRALLRETFSKMTKVNRSVLNSHRVLQDGWECLGMTGTP